MNIKIKENGMMGYCNKNYKPFYLYNIIMRFFLWWSRVKETTKVRGKLYKLQIVTFIWFQLRSWNALIGKEMIINGRKVKSKGGYIYHQLEISKMPVSKTEYVE